MNFLDCLLSAMGMKHVSNNDLEDKPILEVNIEEESARIDDEKKAAEEAEMARIEAEKKAAEEAEMARIEAEKKAAEEEEKARIEEEEMAAMEAEMTRIEEEEMARIEEEIARTQRIISETNKTQSIIDKQQMELSNQEVHDDFPNKTSVSEIAMRI